ncbi:related to NUM1 - nuclear migration protein [Melanopsichium pennsylvanicum]|uniref:Related to NUM1 - nuclear migration protein n=2 Tax=Melanopsichium pennsylvanicum TaxID=63383 RepID=A0AAJ4XN71_9BASI|nr:related to NUM1-nuclear migration protein [Melanopsichium pennsylvanicum 4]SNX84881.1 related to NUM1 - nuclear migration protein [Melanopsichium pennsylvanicum]
MDPNGPDSSSEGLFEGNLPPSPSPASRHVYPASPKDMPTSSSLAFRPPPRPGSSLRKGRKSDFNTPAPPPLPTAPMPIYEHSPLADFTNLGSRHIRLNDVQLLSSPSRATVCSPGSVPTSRPSSENGKTVDLTRLVRERLQVLREENETQVNSAGLLGQGLLELRSKIESLMDELAEELSAAEDQSEDSHGGKPGNARIRDLGEKIEAEIEDLERQKQKLFSEITVHSVDISNGDVAEVSMSSLVETPSKATRVADAIRNLTATPAKSPAAQTGSTPRQTDRRSRNAAARQAKADTDLINEIQAGLVQEVRRLQGLLKERDDQRVSLERSHAELEKQLDQYKPRVIQMTETEDALKQENWDLNVSKQNLEEQLSEIKSVLKKAELDNLRLNKEVGKARETVDSQRLQIDGHVVEIERLNKTRETEIALARRERAGMQRDVSDLQSELQRFRNQQLTQGGVSRSVSNSFMSDVANDDANGDADVLAARLRAASGEAPRSPGESIYSADGAVLSPLGNRLGRDKETQDLRAKLALAQRKAGKDAAEKRRVREKNAELAKLLVKAGVKIPQGLDDDAETSEDEEVHWLDEGNANSPSVKRHSQIRANRPGPVRPPRLGRKMGMVASNSTDSIIEYEEYQDDSQIGTPAGPEDASPSRASLEGMDPAFADFGRGADASIESVAARRGHRSRASMGSSPLARNAILPQEGDEQESPSSQRVLPRSGRRSGATVRPASTVSDPSALGNELGGLATELEQHDTREKVENSMQTDALPDLVGLAIAKRGEEHKAEIASIRSEHNAAIEAVHVEHIEKVLALGSQHTEAILALKQTHEKEIAELTTAHDKSLSDKDEAHTTLMESALAERNKVHEAAIAEARSRHSRALAEQVAASSAALAAAVASHKTSSEDLERKVKDENERKEASHAFALAQKDRQHKESLDALEVSHAESVERLREEHRQLLAIREQALAEADVQLAESEKAGMEAAEKHAAEVAALKKKHADLIAEHDKATKDLEAAQAAAIAEMEKHRREQLAKHEELNRDLVASHAAELVTLQDGHREVLAKHETASKEFAASHAAAVVALSEGHREALASREAELESLKNDLNARSQELVARTQEFGVARSEIEELQKSMTALRAETEQLKQRLAELHKTHTATEQELSETKSYLDMVNDKIQRHEENARELSRQREAEATAAAAAVAARSEALTATEAQKEQLEAAHAVALAQKERQHHDAVKELEDQHANAVAHIRSEYKRGLESRDQTVQTHQQLVAERKKELEEKRAELEKAQAQVQSLEQQLVSERDHAAEVQRQEVAKVQAQVKTLEQQLVDQREKALEEQRTESQKMQAQVQTLEEQLANEREQASKNQRAEVQKVQAQVRSLEQQLVAERERALEQQRTEFGKVQGEAVALEAQIAALQADTSAAQESRSTVEANFKEAQAAYSTLQKQHDEVKATVASLQSKVRYLESSIAAQRSSTEQNRIASDKELQTIQSALNTAQKKVREQEATIAKAEAAAAVATAAAAAAEAQLLVKHETVTDTENEAEDFKDAVEANDVAATETVKELATPQVAKVELTESSCQTDDEAWKQFQERQHAKASATAVAVQTSAPPSPIQPTSQSIAAQNNLVILGGFKPSNRARDSVGTFGDDRASSPANMLYSADAFISSQNHSRRPSADSTWSRHTDRYTSEAIPPVPPLPDKTKAPTMSMPPPPSVPPPSHKRNVLATGSGVAPPRPTSPPPVDLLTRAQQRHLQVPAGSGEQPRSVSRASGRSGPPPSAFPLSSTIRARQQSSGTTGSVRSRTYSNDSNGAHPLDGSIYSNLASGSGRKSIGSKKSVSRRPAAGPRQSSAASFVSDVTSEVSRRLSMMSSRASDAGDDTFVVRGQSNGKARMGGLSEFGADSTDPAIIHAITQTMIGEYMHKYTRKSMGRGGHSDKRHRRYFWLHPYTKMLYWTISDPGGAKVSEGTSKSASIESVRVVEDSNPNPPGLHPESIVIRTATREVKISAPNRERHEAWLAALEYLVHRPTMQDATVIASNAAPDLMSDADNDPTLVTRSSGRRAKPRASAVTLGSNAGSRRLSAQRSFLGPKGSDRGLGTESTPRRRGSSIGASSVLYPSLSKRPDSAAKAYLQQHEHNRELAHATSMSPSASLRGATYADANEDDYDLLDLTATQSPIRRGLASDDARLKTAEQMLEEDEGEDYEGITNVRACCDGKHDVGSLAHQHHHQHHAAGSDSRKSSRLHRRESSGASRFSSIGLKSKLDAAVKAAEDKEREQEAVPQIPASLLPSGGGNMLGKGTLGERESTDSNASANWAANVFGAASNDSATTKGSGWVGPSYGERISRIRKARQSAGSATGSK